jgi:DNA-binding transcriptional MerR regulator
MNAQPARPYLGIGEVLAKLRTDFPDVSVSKIRFLESEGLIAPARSPSGYRKFAVADVERLRYILTAQRDHYLPLRVIRERLVPAAAAGQADGAGSRGTAAAAPGQDGQPALLSRRELLAAAGISDEQLAELEDFGLLRRRGRQFGQDALEVARTVGALAAYGVEARHLRAVRAAAEREMSLIEQVIAPTLRQRNAAARQDAGAAARQIAALSLRLHRALIETALAEAGLPGTGLPDAGPPGSAGPAWPDEAAGLGSEPDSEADGYPQSAQRRAAGGGGGHAGRGFGGASA